MTKICIFNGDMSRGGGTERITQLLSTVLIKQKKYEIWVLSLNNDSGTSYYPLDVEVKVAILPKGAIIKKVFELLKFVREKEIDILINVDVMLGIFSLPVSWIRPRTKIVAWEMFNINNDIGSRHTKMIRQLSLWCGDYFITQTKADMEAFQRRMRVRCPITYIYNPCIRETVYHGYDKTSKTIVTAGHFFKTKGYDLAVETARIVFQKHPDWKWEFYGDGVQLETVKDMVKDYKLENNVIFCGRTTQIMEAYKKAAMYVMTSRSEGFGLVLTEAKVCNLPTLSFDVDFGPREIIENGISGYLVEAFDVESMAKCICELIENEEKRISYSTHAQDNLYLFSMDAFSKKWVEVIEEIKKPKKRRN